MNIQERIMQPESLVSIVAFIFSLWWVWATLNNRIKELEMKMKEVDWLGLEAKLAQIMTDLEWIKTKLESK